MPDIDSVTVEHWDKILRTNVVGTFLVSQAALPLLREAEVRVDRERHLPGRGASDRQFPALRRVEGRGLNHLTSIMAKHAGGGVRVNAVAPGLIATPWTEEWGA